MRVAAPSLPRKAAALNAEWVRLADELLPLISGESIWRHNAACETLTVEQGWKLHISATVLSATSILASVGDLVRDSHLPMKGPRTLVELMKLNAGIGGGFSQVGKVLTIYTGSPEEAVEVGHRIDGLVGEVPAPRVPFERTVRTGSSVYYRFGAFKHVLLKNDDQDARPAMRAPDGHLVPDERGPDAVDPPWVTDPFADASNDSTQLRGHQQVSELFGRGFLVYEALSQRGKGGVYRALDVRRGRGKVVILKEGRRHGETGWDGRDGAYRVRHEGKVIDTLHGVGIATPKVTARLRVGRTAYLAMEELNGTLLQAQLEKSRLGIADALALCAELASVVGDLHGAGWVWRDCKPPNLFVTEAGVIPIDFEGAAPIGTRELQPWITPGYLSPDLASAMPSTCAPSDDIYSLGVTIHQVLSGVPKPTASARPIGSLRRGIPKSVRDLIGRMLDPDSASRPTAHEAARVLASGS